MPFLAASPHHGTLAWKEALACVLRACRSEVRDRECCNFPALGVSTPLPVSAAAHIGPARHQKGVPFLSTHCFSLLCTPCFFPFSLPLMSLELCSMAACGMAIHLSFGVHGDVLSPSSILRVRYEVCILLSILGGNCKIYTATAISIFLVSGWHSFECLRLFFQKYFYFSADETKHGA